MTRARDVATQGGLVLIVNTPFTSVSSVSINNCFSSAYKNYKVFINYDVSSTTTRTVSLRMRTNGVDDSSAKYQYGISGRDSNNAAVSAGAFDQTSALMTRTAYYTGVNYILSLDFGDPFTSTVRTSAFGLYQGVTSAYDEFGTTGFVLNTVNSHDGFTLINSAANFTGRIRVYGYKEN